MAAAPDSQRNVIFPHSREKGGEVDQPVYSLVHHDFLQHSQIYTIPSCQHFRGLSATWRHLKSRTSAKTKGPLASSSSPGLMMSESTTLSAPCIARSSRARPVPSWPRPPVIKTLQWRSCFYQQTTQHKTQQ